MKNLSRNQIITILLVILMALLLIIGLVISLRIRQVSQAPDDSFAFPPPPAGSPTDPSFLSCYDGCMPSCLAGATAGDRANDPAAQESWRNGCPDGCRRQCTQSGEFDVNGSCSLINDGGINGCIVVRANDGNSTNSCDNNINIYRFTRPMNGPNDDCFTGDNQFLQWPNAGPGRYCASDIVEPCQCTQIDYTYPNGDVLGVKAGRWVAACSECGAVCSGTGQSTCNEGLTCSNSRCVLPECAANPSLCAANRCSLLSTPVCGDPDFVPGPGQCSPRNTATCNANCQPIVPNPICGQACDANTPCSGGAVCDSSINTCVIPECLGRDDCINNGCALPNTAIFGDGRDVVLLGTLLIIVGLFINYKVPTMLFNSIDVSMQNQVNLSKRKTREKLNNTLGSKLGRRFEKKLKNIDK